MRFRGIRCENGLHQRRHDQIAGMVAVRAVLGEVRSRRVAAGNWIRWFFPGHAVTEAERGRSHLQADYEEDGKKPFHQTTKKKIQFPAASHATLEEGRRAQSL